MRGLPPLLVIGFIVWLAIAIFIVYLRFKMIMAVIAL